MFALESVLRDRLAALIGLMKRPPAVLRLAFVAKRLHLALERERLVRLGDLVLEERQRLRVER